MRIRLLGVGVKMGIVDGGHAQSDDVIRCPETFADHEYIHRSSNSVLDLICSVAHDRHSTHCTGHVDSHDRAELHAGHSSYSVDPGPYRPTKSVQFEVS